VPPVAWGHGVALGEGDIAVAALRKVVDEWGDDEMDRQGEESSVEVVEVSVGGFPYARRG